MGPSLPKISVLPPTLAQRIASTTILAVKRVEIVASMAFRVVLVEEVVTSIMYGILRVTGSKLSPLKLLNSSSKDPVPLMVASLVRKGLFLPPEAMYMLALASAKRERVAELVTRQSTTSRGEHIQCTISEEEASFGKTLDNGVEKFKRAAQDVQGKELSGQVVLSDTYGFLLYLTQLMADTRGLKIDVEGFDSALNEARARSSNAKNNRSGGTQVVMDADRCYLVIARERSGYNN
ncbi:hypothetical protein RJ639_026819 [Escallonia herrerae]|uniref:Alanyl-tRNA synthetase class IIc N-terminal domain-containing protein n=1 Tax=Escallonia herrerae TaxID=1293975 RepID=A0AA88X8E9_9ASTE|nr:hypothetical protein RJ639_026819 [Escallonia herrerae]